MIGWPAAELVADGRIRGSASAGNHSRGNANKDRLVPLLRRKRNPYGQEVRFRPLPTMRTWSMSVYPNRQRDRVESALSGRSSRPTDTKFTAL